jgi:hypothetical protein
LPLAFGPLANHPPQLFTAKDAEDVKEYTSAAKAGFKKEALPEA